MRSVVYAAVVLAGLMTGCAHQAGTYSDLFIPDGEAIYERPVEEMWPEVRQYFTEDLDPAKLIRLTIGEL